MGTGDNQGERGQSAFLRAGIAAFKQGQHDLAIQHLQLAEVDSSGDELLQIQGWLVRAYAQTHRYDEARDLCETLTRCDRPSVQAWARQVLDQLPAPTPTPESAPAEDMLVSPPPRRPSPEPTDAYPNSSGFPARDRLSPSPAPRPTAATIRRPSVKRRQRDATPLILSAIAHGSISLFGSLLLWLLFPESSLATALGVARLFIPILIFLLAKDPLTKENAREASNYTINTLVLAVVAIAGALPMAIVGVGLLTSAPGLLLLLAVPLVGYLALLALAPLIATVYCCLNGGQVAHYPNWLILHLL